EGQVGPRVQRWLTTYRGVFWLCALALLAIAGSDGPEGLTHAEPAEFARRTLYGTLFAAALIMPYALGGRSKWLESTWMQALGRWSYSIFLWHM
ncbi:acyltransferase, partial [Bacillus thuringiensis]|nr:acyltransferase [Bacillus thuringiensis]